MNNIIEFFSERLKLDLPGWEIQKNMAPQRILEFIDNYEMNPDIKKSAALVLLYQPIGARSASVILTLRSENLSSHKGQISFPGGRLEEDESFEQAAIREAREEIGIDLTKIRLLGRLSPIYIPPSNSLMLPILAFCDDSLNFKINDSEVQEILITPLSQLEKTKILTKSVNAEYYGERIDAPQWNIHPQTPLWGATAMVLYELVTLMEDFHDGEYPLIDLFARKELHKQN